MNEPVSELDGIRHSVEAHCQGLRIDSLVSLSDEGQYNRLFLANREIVLRFPRYAGGELTLQRETQILQHIQGKVSLKTPHVLCASRADARFGETFLAYGYLQGQPLWGGVLEAQTDATVRRRLAHQLGAFLAELHGIALWDEAQSWPILDSADDWRQMYEEIQAHLFSAMRPDARRAVDAHFAAYLQDPTIRTFTPCLRHGDFGSGNVLYDPAAQAISGIIDFGGAGMGDPAVDLAAASCFGDEMFAGICEAYSGASAHLARAAFYRGTFALQEALHGVRTGDQEAYQDGMASYV